ncbi:Ribosomal RNA small subunit methyltransferase G [Convivina praedatoris]|uniref:Ribosomal RNA small subunit methyltransferase G n=1 Tax=Convivina praedatoris TaxID=2880963 RepID=A0ABN8H7P6_9LACO|nr:16S rRNA (guanine(527)-N(7))-methyltransferase RsmG [Convivina sp. LMG 32447]CAH1849876.1 Ribosomal RNA small subunit methyltransferase G [Convivina sp. LMG 32447]CAH1851324.1 Ribosomal RNA small subunit methyltransferase G [Convivina sp. LMG 32447]CAH1851336.1 Ribosomal RNA small subunit methyltransferase G [Convivina sp. LMG 32447]
MKNSDFLQALAEHDIYLNEQQENQFERYFELLVETNRLYNLTAITERDDVYLKHFYDSLTLAIYVRDLSRNDISLVDVGAGAGFPSLPLKILFPNLNVTMIEALNKRVSFLKNVIRELNLDGVSVIHGRAEDLAHDKNYREKFDYATARAVARTSVLAEYTLPFVRLNGKLLVMKGSAADDELADGKRALTLLGGRLDEQFDFELFNNDARVIQVVEKMNETPRKYPRQAGIPSRKPL